MTLQKTLKTQKIAFMKNKEVDTKAEIAVINEILTGIKYKAAKDKTTEENISDNEVLKIINNIYKQLVDEKTSLEKANRDASYVQKKVEYASSLLPKVKTGEELKLMVEAYISSNNITSFKEVMQYFKTKASEVNMAEVNKFAKELLK